MRVRWRWMWIVVAFLVAGVSSPVGAVAVVQSSPAPGVAAARSGAIWGTDDPVYFSTDMWGSAEVTYFSGTNTTTVGAGELPADRSNRPRIVTEAGQIVFSDPAHTRLPENSHGLFWGVAAGEIEGLGDLDTSHVTDMSYMFADTPSLEIVDMSGWDTSNVTNMSFMFDYAVSLRELVLSADVHLHDDSVLPPSFGSDDYEDVWQLVGDGSADAPTGEIVGSSADLMALTRSDGFVGAHVVRPAKAVGGDDPPQITPGEVVVKGGVGVGREVSVVVDGFAPQHVWYTYQWLIDGAAVEGATRSSFTIPAWALGRELSVSVTAEKNGYLPVTVTSEAVTVETAAESGIMWGTAPVTPRFEDGIMAVAVGAGDLTERKDRPDWLQEMEYIFFRHPSQTRLPENSSGLFQGLNIRLLNAYSLDTSRVTNMSYMFEDTLMLAEVDASGWDTSNVTDMSYMFAHSYELTRVDVSGWDTSGVTDMSNMFASPGKLTSLDVSGWNTSSVTDMSNMFSGAGMLTSLDMSGWDMSGVTNMSCMLCSTFSLRELVLSADVHLVDGVGLPLSFGSDEYEDVWQFVGDGSADAPTGEVIGSSADLVALTRSEGFAGAHVVRPAKSGGGVEPPAVAAGSVVVEGDALPGREVSAVVSGFVPADVSYAYLWLLDGGVVEGATGESFTVPADAAGRELSVSVSAEKAGYSPVTVTSETVTVKAAPVPGGLCGIVSALWSRLGSSVQWSDVSSALTTAWKVVSRWWSTLPGYA